MQLDHYSSKFKARQFPITLVCDNVTNAPNIGSLFRTADAFGISKLILCGKDIILGRKMQKTARATENYVNFELKDNASEVVAHLKSLGHNIVVLEITQQSKPIHHFHFETDKPVVLIIGDENFGVSEDIIALADGIIHIEMFGQNSSMNVVQATTISLYEITKQLKPID